MSTSEMQPSTPLAQPQGSVAAAPSFEMGCVYFISFTKQQLPLQHLSVALQYYEFNYPNMHAYGSKYTILAVHHCVPSKGSEWFHLVLLA